MTDNSTFVSLGTEDTVLALALVFCILLLAVGFKQHSFWILAGPSWILCGVKIFNQYDPAFMYLTVGVGMVLLIWGAYNAFD